MIGKGNFGEVWIAKWHFVSTVAVKKLLSKEVSTKETEKFLHELQLMSQLRAPNVTQVFGGFSDENNNLNIVMEYLDGGSLKNYLEDLVSKKEFLSLKRILTICLEITAGMIFLSSKGVIHRDLAARNILVSNDLKIIKVADFGLAKATETYYKGTFEKPIPVKWCSIEVIKNRKYSEKSDVWSWAVTVWEIFSYGDLPYSTMINGESLQFIVDGNRLSQPNNCPLQLYNLLLECWDFDPEKRPTFLQIILRLREIESCIFSEQEQSLVSFQVSTPIKEKVVVTAVRQKRESEAPNDVGKCFHCGKNAVFNCSRCLLVKYCSRECQIADWKQHKSSQTNMK